MTQREAAAESLEAIGKVTADRQNNALAAERRVPGYGSAAVDAAGKLRDALAQHKITADVHDGYGLALVSVWAGLVVWSNGDRFWWNAGWDDRRRCAVYASQPTSETVRAAQRIAFRYVELRKSHPRSEPIAESMS